jgi:hypothetical protein
MIYLTRGHRVAILEEGCNIERIENVILITSPNASDIEFKYEVEQMAIIAFNHLLERLGNYSSACGISI